MKIHALLLLLLWVAVVTARSDPRLAGWYPGTDCRSEAPTDRWRKDCNWCSCRDGRGACTRKLCRGGESRETPGSPCEGNPTWKDGCNTCRCVEGRAVCLENICDQSSQQSVQTMSRVIHPSKAECDNGSRWRVNCNWCTCEDGISHCTEALCVDWNEQKAQEEGIVQCHGSSHWRKDCNWCTCVNGQGRCSQRACIPRERDPFHNLPKSATCVPGSRWLNDCNWCSCGDNGNALCTLMACPEGLAQEEPNCEEGSLWRNDACNLCRCIDGRSACTKRLCRTPPQVVQEPQVVQQPEDPQEPEEPEKPQDPQCQGDSRTDRWRMDCNWCSCKNGVGACTRRVCPEGVKDKEEECEGNPSWMKDCNRCSCVNGKAVCTFRLCGGPPPPQAKEPECRGDNETDRWTQDCNWCSCRNGVPGCTKKLCREGVKDLGRCEGNPSWMKDCNRCHCNNGTALCTTKYCGTPIRPQSRRSQVAVVKNKNAVCEAGARWRVGCNWCSCSNGMAICTEKACLDQHAGSDEPECEGYASWKDDCNWCTCGDGYALCTRMACLKKSDEPCTEGRSWRNDCNTCRCSHGFVLCTKRACRQHGEQIECQGDSCGPRELPELCKLPPVEGLIQCAGFIKKWSFSTSDGMCGQIVYGGCAGTENLFDSEEECKATCPTTTTTTQNRGIDEHSKTQGSERCNLPQDQGPCFGAMPRFAYNAESGLCEDFLFGGCAGNANNFKTEEECLAACKPSKALDTCDKSKCAWELWEHYLVKQCVPQYAGDACCPTSFQCPSASEVGKDLTKCFYKGVSYKVGDSVPVEDPCSAQCRCFESHDPSEPAKITCANVECPELFRPVKSGCRNLYRADRCCAYDQECVDPDGPSLEPRSATCTWQNNTYPVGAVMTVDGYPCRRCICEAGFTDPLGPGCSKIDCGLEFRYTSQLHQGCSPIHFETGHCCPIDWMCPDDSKIIPPQQQQQSGSSDESSVCHLGESRLGVGEALTLTDCKIECRCLTPPELTCIQYRSCEVAREAAAQRACPPLKCDNGCHPVVGSPGQCPTCSCSPDTFSCPAQTCPSSCTSVVDLETGCPTCKCKCTKELRCPLGCPSHTVLDQDTGCPRCECKPGSTQILNPEVCHVHPGGVVPCPQDCAIIKTVDENGCEVCKCDPNDPGNPFMRPLPPMFAQETACAYPRGKAPCPMDCAILRTVDDNGCEVCGCDPNNPGNPFGPPPPVLLHGTACAYPRGEAPCPMDCAILRSMDDNGCEVCGCDPNNPGNPFGPPPPTQIRVRRSCPGEGEAPCPMDCAILRSMDDNGCEVCGCDPNNPGNPFGPPPTQIRVSRSCPGKWEAPCPMDCGVIRYKDDNDCWRCKCDPKDTNNPFTRPLPIIFPEETACAYPRGEAPCPMDCAIIRVNDENDCEVCKCDPNNPGNPFFPSPPELYQPF